MEKKVLRTRVDMVTKPESMKIVSKWIFEKEEPKLIVTAYSEFFVTARSDEDFEMALEGADLVTPDGIGPLAAIFFNNLVKPQDNVLEKIIKGLSTGLAIIAQKVGEPVSGYWLFQNLIGKATDKNWKVFLLGGFGETAGKLALKLSNKYKGLRIKYDAGAQTEQEINNDVVNDRVIQKINRFKPDLLFVAYGPVKQEKWLMKYKKDLKAKVMMGVGGTFDEALGLVKEAPVAFEKMGLKWLWRLIQQPARLPRIFKATFVFAWLVFVDSLKKK